MIGKTNTNMTTSASKEWEALQAKIKTIRGEKTDDAAKTAATDKTATDKTAATQETAAYDPKAQLKEMVANLLAKNTSNASTASPFSSLFSNSGSNSSAGNSFDQLLNGLGLNNLTGKQAQSMNYARAQFELNYSAIQTLSGADGSSYTNAVSFSLKLDFQSLTTGGAANPLGITGNESADGLMSKLQDYFSPEKTSDRILGFALNFFPKSDAYKKGGDTEESRQQFSDYIGKAIQKGFDQAMGTLGKVSDEVQAGIDKTHNYVFDGLNGFVKNGITEKNQQQIAAAMSYSLSFSMQMSQTQVLYTPDGKSGSGSASAGLLNTQG